MQTMQRNEITKTCINIVEAINGNVQNVMIFPLFIRSTFSKGLNVLSLSGLSVKNSDVKHSWKTISPH